MTTEEAAAHVAELWAGWGLPELGARVRLEPSRRMTRALGCFVPSRGLIRIAARVLERGPEALVREVLCHEAAHAAVHARCGGRVRPHGAEWRALMRSAGLAPRARLPAPGLVPRPPRRGWLRRPGRFW